MFLGFSPERGLKIASKYREYSLHEKTTKPGCFRASSSDSVQDVDATSDVPWNTGWVRGIPTD